SAISLPCKITYPSPVKIAEHAHARPVQHVGESCADSIVAGQCFQGAVPKRRWNRNRRGKTAWNKDSCVDCYTALTGVTTADRLLTTPLCRSWIADGFYRRQQGTQGRK